MAYSANYDVSEGKDLDTQLGSPSRSVIVDNYTRSWIWLPTVGRSVPPFTYGFIGNHLSNTQRGHVMWQTPYKIKSSPKGGDTAQVIFTDAVLPPSNGVQVITPTANAPVILETLPDSGGAISAKKVTIPSGMEAIGLFSNQTPAGTITVTGNQSGFIYINAVPATDGSIVTGLPGLTYPVPLDPRDDTVDFEITSNSGIIDLVAYPFIPSPQEIAVYGTKSGQPVLTIPGAVPNLQMAAFEQHTIAAGTATVVIAAVGGKVITIYGISWNTSASQGTFGIGFYSAQLETSPGLTPLDVITFRIIQTTAAGELNLAGPAHSYAVPGRVLPTGNGVSTLTNAINVGALDMTGTILFTQI